MKNTTTPTATVTINAKGQEVHTYYGWTRNAGELLKIKKTRKAKK